jgi:predicted Zn-dependent protease
LALVVFLSLCAGCTSGLFGARPLASTTIRVQEEQQLGAAALRLVLQQGGGSFGDSNLISYVETLGEDLALQTGLAPLSFRFAVVNDSAVNSFALPGAVVVITRGLLVKLANEAELAAVLGHELGHIRAGHCLHGLGRAALLESPGEAAGLLTSDPFIRGAARLLREPYAAVEEIEADRLGIDFMIKAGYPPSGLLQLQTEFSRAADGGLDAQGLGARLFSHPFGGQRLAENRNYIRQQYPQASEIGGDEAEFLRGMQYLQATRQGYASFNQARQLEQQGQLAAAISRYHQALLEAPDEPLILTSLGLAYLRNNDLVPARRYLLKAVHFQGDYYQSRLALGYVYQQKQQYAEAREQLEVGFSLLPTLEGGYMLAAARQQTGDFEGARQLFAAVAGADARGKLGRNAADKLKQLGK